MLIYIQYMYSTCTCSSLYQSQPKISNFMFPCRAAELEILVTDMERANQRAVSAEKQVESLQSLQSTSIRVTSTPDKVGMASCSSNNSFTIQCRSPLIGWSWSWSYRLETKRLVSECTWLLCMLIVFASTYTLYKGCFSASCVDVKVNSFEWLE